MKSRFLKQGYLENINRKMEKIKFKKQVFSRRGGVTKGVSSFTQVSEYNFVHLYLLHIDKKV